MRGLTMFLITALVGIGVMATPAKAAQVGFGVQIGPAPVCPYGYYAAPPYDCAPYGYYGPDWFPNGAFIGAGPWYDGDDGFYGWVNRDYDHDHFRGHFPHRGEHAEHRLDRMDHFRGNERVDGHGHAERGRQEHH